MHTEILHNPDFGVLRVRFDQPGEEISSEAGAMVGRDTAVQMRTNLQGGFGGALKRKLLGGESLFQNTFTGTMPGQSVWIAPAAEGTVESVTLQPGVENRVPILRPHRAWCLTPSGKEQRGSFPADCFFSGPSGRASCGSPPTVGCIQLILVVNILATFATTRTW